MHWLRKHLVVVLMLTALGVGMTLRVLGPTDPPYTGGLVTTTTSYVHQVGCNPDVEDCSADHYNVP